MGPAERLKAAGRLFEHAPLAPLTTYKFGGPARYLVVIDGEPDLVEAHHLAVDTGLEVLALGRGSNVVVADSGFSGIVLQAGPGLNEREIGEMVSAGAAVPLPVLARESALAGRGGLEFYTGIPGSVGGAVRMNAGCHGTETSDVLVTARVFDLRTGAVSDRDRVRLDLSYRHSNLGDAEFVVSARFSTVERDPEVAKAEIRAITKWRREHQPGGTLNAGSVFKNPPGDSAGRIIDDLGLKGLRRGAVRVSERHANFFVADDGATAADVHALVGEVLQRVRDGAGIELEPEIRFVGDFT